jgi:predicted DNA-binding antitoxin AbrB/MazE fold protein
MVKTIEALFDGAVFRPAEPIALEPNTVVRITIETTPPIAGEATSFLRTARSLNLDGPPDWSANIDKYL